MKYQVSYEKKIDEKQLQDLFLSVKWKSGEYPWKLKSAIINGDYVVSLWDKEKLIGLISTISDGAINVFITYLLIHPDYQRQGLGTYLMKEVCNHYKGFGRQILTTEFDKEDYYSQFQFQKEGIAMFLKDWE